MVQLGIDDPAREAGTFQGVTAADIAMEYGYAPTRSYVDPRAKEDASASPASFPEITPSRHQHAQGGLDDEAALCCGQTPCPDLIARRYWQFLQDGGVPGRCEE